MKYQSGKIHNLSSINVYNLCSIIKQSIFASRKSHPTYMK
nr:MAG TPA: hypothetical protein [Caudoviricetes sp.]